MVQTDVGQAMESPKGRNVTFVSHASEDKQFVKNLVDTLLRFGVNAWYDGYEIRPGMPIRETVNAGLLSAEYGVVVLSHAFFQDEKRWTKNELAALAELLAVGKLIPIYYEISVDELKRIDPLIMNTRGIPVPDGDIRQVVAPLTRIILGSGHEEGNRLVYRRETVPVFSVPISARQKIEQVTFDGCIIQGPAVLVVNGSVRFEQVFLNSDRVVWPNPEVNFFAGTVGLNDVTFRGSRFKDVGFVVASHLRGHMPPVAPSGYVWPEHLQ